MGALPSQGPASQPFASSVTLARLTAAGLARVGGALAAARVGMRAEVRVAAVTVGDVRVALGRSHVGVAEHLLDAAQVGAALEEMRRERVAQEMRVDATGFEPRSE